MWQNFYNQLAKKFTKKKIKNYNYSYLFNIIQIFLKLKSIFNFQLFFLACKFFERAVIFNLIKKYIFIY